MTPPNRGVFVITPGAVYELIDGRQFMAVTCPEDASGVVFVSRDGQTTLLVRESHSGGLPVTALVSLTYSDTCPGCTDIRSTDFTAWDLEERPPASR